MSPFFDAFPYPSQRMPTLAKNVVSASQPLASQAGLRMLLAGGNAVDAALAAAMTLTVVEPVMNGIGGDMFAIVWDGQQMHGLNSTGVAPAGWTRERFAARKEMPQTGWDTVTVPGQVAGWKALHDKFGKLAFTKLFEPAIEYAQQGFMVSPQIARQWAMLSTAVMKEPGFAQAFTQDGRIPVMGELWRFPDQAKTLQQIAESGGDSFYKGPLAEAIVDFARKTGGSLSLEDLAGHRAEWVVPLAKKYRGYTLHEIPPSGQGIAALIALGILEHFDLGKLDGVDFYHLQIEAVKLAFADLHAHVAQPASMKVSPEELLAPAYLADRARLIHPKKAVAATAGLPKMGGTVYLAAADASGMMVSFIQSNYRGFGSGVVVPGTGISLHNRGENFSLVPGHPNEIAPGKRPFHTIIPGFITKDEQPVMAFGVMGGAMQAQGHVQMMARLADYDQNAQAMNDAPRFRVDPGRVSLEHGVAPEVVSELSDRGHKVSVFGRDSLDFGAAQLIARSGAGYIGASDSRRDGQAVGF